jgi:aldehyde dehydrogenase (NAD+)
MAQAADIVRSAGEYFASEATRPVAARREALRRLRRAVELGEEALLDALHADLRKPRLEAYASEVGFVLADFDHAIRHVPGWARPRRRRAPLALRPGSARLHPDPYGTALILGPWNYPFQLLFSPLVGAVAAGCTVVLKPSEYAPAVSACVARLVREAVEPGWVTVVEGDAATAAALLEQRFDCLFFTGSTAVGRIVLQAAARHLTPATLELGGKSPCIVCEDADLAVAARRIAWGKFMNAGQTCVAPDHVWVARPVAPAFHEQLAAALRRFYGPDPQRSPDYGRIVSRRHFDRVVAYLGCGSIAHGGQHDAADLYLAPTVLRDVPLDSPAMQEEIFGPVLPVLEFDRLDDVLAELRRRPKPLALYLFTRCRGTQARVLEGTSSGGACINDTVRHLIAKDLPFGGVGASGMGAYHGRASFDAFTHYRGVLTRSTWPDPAALYPPARVSVAFLRRFYRRWLQG